MLGYVKSFLPWIAFAILSTDDQYRMAAIVGFAVAVLLLILDRRRGKAWDALIIEISSAVFFGLLTLAAVVISPAPLGAYGPAVSIGWLALTAWGSLAVRRPFTLGIARTMVPAEVHGSPLFYRTNAVITSVWAGAFTINTVLLAVLLTVAPHATVALIAVKIGGFVVPAVFTVRYSNAVRARRQTAR
jgi:hypothetical protein